MKLTIWLVLLLVVLIYLAGWIILRAIFDVHLPLDEDKDPRL